jgi:hypothetical protein
MLYENIQIYTLIRHLHQNMQEHKNNSPAESTNMMISKC